MTTGAEAQTQDPSLEHFEVVPLGEGPNAVDVIGWGRPGMVARGRYNNYNAHSFDYYTFYVAYPDSESGRVRWDVVPFLSGPRTEMGISTHQGADCVLRDLRILKPLATPPTAVVVVIADRDMGTSYADSQLVTFSVFELRTNSAFAPGEPGIYFQRVRTLRSKRKYCDVEEAFRAELGFGPGAR